MSRSCTGVAIDADIVDGCRRITEDVIVVVPIEDDFLSRTYSIGDGKGVMRPAVNVTGGWEQRNASWSTTAGDGCAAVKQMDGEFVPVAFASHSEVEFEMVFHSLVGEVHVEGGVCVGVTLRVVGVGETLVFRDVERAVGGAIGRGGAGSSADIPLRRSSAGEGELFGIVMAGILEVANIRQ